MYAKWNKCDKETRLSTDEKGKKGKKEEKKLQKCHREAKLESSTIGNGDLAYERCHMSWHACTKFCIEVFLR